MERTISRRVFLTGSCVLGVAALGDQLVKSLLIPESHQEVFPIPKTPIPSVTPESYIVDKVEWPKVTMTPVPQVAIISSLQEEETEYREQKKDLKNSVKFPTPTSTPILKPTPTETAVNLTNSFIWRGDVTKPKVALTIDDGWWKESIIQITEVLRETKTKSTLFVPGQALSAFPQLWRELDTLGCKFECHSYTHRFDVTKLSVEEILEEIDRSQSTLNQVLGKHKPFSFYRPVGGTMSENIVKAMKARNLRGVIWTLSGEGTSKIATPETVTRRILTLSGNGYITLHHFIKNDAVALRPIILGLRGKGLTPCCLDEIV